MFRRLTIGAAISAALLVTGTPALAKGHNASATAACSVSASRVDAVGLPTDQVINFMMTDNSGTSSWVLGTSSDGTASVAVPAQNGPTTYQFISRVSGPDGSRYTVFASC